MASGRVPKIDRILIKLFSVTLIIQVEQFEYYNASCGRLGKFLIPHWREYSIKLSIPVRLVSMKAQGSATLSQIQTLAAKLITASKAGCFPPACRQGRIG